MIQISDYDPGRLFSLINAGIFTNALWSDILVISIIVVCLMFSSFFSAIETALSTANIIRLKKTAEEKSRRAGAARKAILLIENYDRTITSILIGNNLVNIGASTAGVFVFTNLITNPSIASLVSTAVMTIVVIIFGEIIPKTYAKANSTDLAVKFARLTWFFNKLFYPFAIFFMKFTKVLKGAKQTERQSITGEELESIIDEMEDEGLLDEDHADLLQGALSLGNKRVYDIMTPRVDMIAVDVNDSIENILNTFLDSQYSRLPVYEEDKDNIIGVLQSKDFLSTLIINKDHESLNIRDLIISPIYVSKATKVDDLIKEMQEEKKHFAIVSDEHGGTSGIVTMEDALEELVGEIYDEYDIEEDEVLMKKIDDNSYELLADLELKDLYETLDLGTAPSGNYATVSGFVYDLLEELPEEGEEVSVDVVKTVYDEEKIKDEIYQLTFKLIEVENRRIRKLQLTVTNKENILVEEVNEEESNE